MNVVAFWLRLSQDYKFKLDITPIGMFKSELLGRLMRGEEVRRRPCPRHKGVMWCSWGGIEQFHANDNERWGTIECPGCDNTGWLKNEHPI